MAVKKHHGVLRFGHNAHAFCRFSFLWHMGLGVLHCHLGRTAAVGYAGVLGAKALNSDPHRKRGAETTTTGDDPVGSGLLEMLNNLILWYEMGGALTLKRELTHLWLGISIQPGSLAHYGQMQGLFSLLGSCGKHRQCPQEMCLSPWKDRRCVGHWLLHAVQKPLSWRWDLGGKDQPASQPFPSACACPFWLCPCWCFSWSPS